MQPRSPLPDNHSDTVISLFGTAWSRKISSDLPFIKPTPMLIILCVMCLVFTVRFAGNSFGSLLDILPITTFQAVYMNILITITLIYVGLFGAALPKLLTTPPKHIASLPINRSQWFNPQFLQIYRGGFLIFSSMLAGIHISYNQHVQLPNLLYILGTYVLLASVVIFLYSFFKLITALSISKYSTCAPSSIFTVCLSGLLIVASRSQSFTKLIENHESWTPTSSTTLAVISLVIVCLGIFLRRINNRVLQNMSNKPLRFISSSHKAFRPLFGIGTARYSRPTILFVLCGLRYMVADMKHWLFAALMILSSAASVVTAVIVDDPSFDSFALASIGTSLPVGIASWMSVMRGGLGQHKRSIRYKPYNPQAILIPQLLVSGSAGALLSAGILWGAQAALSINGSLLENIPQGLLTGLLCMLAYASGVLLYPRTQTTIDSILVLLGLFILAAITQYVDQKAREHSVLFANILLVAAIGLTGLATMNLESGSRRFQKDDRR